MSSIYQQAGGVPRWLLRIYYDRAEIEAAFARGIVRDVPRHAQPVGGSYDLLDFLCDRPGMLYKRGGAAYQSEALSGQDDIIAVAAPEFPGDPRVVAFASDSFNTTLYDITTDTPGSPQDCNSALIYENPPLYVNRLIICDARALLGLSPHAPQKAYLDTGAVVVANLGGSPPVAAFSCLHAGRLILANGSLSGTACDGTYPNRVWFSDPLDAEQPWDVCNAYIDVDEPITGLASIQGVLLVFSRGSCQRILGDIPPGYGTLASEVNMSLQPAIRVGCIDARSIVRDEDYVYVANESGLYALNGAGADNITTNNDASGINTLWAEMVDGFAPALGSVVASGLYQNHLFVTVTRRAHDDVPEQRNTICRYLNTGAWSRLSNGAGAVMYATRFAPFYEMYYGLNDESADDANRARRMGDIFTPSSANPTDPDGADIEPLWESRTLGMTAGVGMKHWGLAHLTYKLVSDDTPTLAITESVGLEAGGSFDAVPESPLAKSTNVRRSRFFLSRQNQGLTLRVVQDGSSEQTEVYLLEYSVRDLQPGGGPQ